MLVQVSENNRFCIAMCGECKVGSFCEERVLARIGESMAQTLGSRTLDLGVRVTPRDLQEFLAEIVVVLQDLSPRALAGHTCCYQENTDNCQQDQHTED